MEVKHPHLFLPWDLANTQLKNRIVMAPMTRSRSSQPGNIPNELMATYYSQRASVGLIITEATQVSLQGQGYSKTPGIYTTQQVQGWKKVSTAVHAAGGKIFLQLWHVGRVSSSKVNGLQPIAPSEILAKDTQVYFFEGPKEELQFTPVEKPRQMTTVDIQRAIQEFRQGAINAIEAGFDGVEIHGANGYLIDQFLRSNSNKRTDVYGGNAQDRLKFLLETCKEVIAAVGKEKTAVRLSPFIKIKDMDDPEILHTIMLAAKELDTLGITYIHLCEADWDDAPQIPLSFRKELRAAFSGTIIATGNKTPELGQELIANGLVDLVGFGRNIIANPDYAERVIKSKVINKIADTHTLFAGGSVGYVDYPFLEE